MDCVGAEVVYFAVATVCDNEFEIVVEECDAVLVETERGPEALDLHAEVVNQGVLLADDDLAGCAQGALESAQRCLGGSVVDPEVGFGVQGSVLQFVLVAAS